MERYQRRTNRLTTQLGSVIRESAGRAGARLSRALACGISRSTALRMLMCQVATPLRVPRVLGIDDFALKGRHRYATVIIDAETGEGIDVLPDRTAQTLTTWPREHPGAQYVCRDGSATYAEAIRQALPYGLAGKQVVASSCGARWSGMGRPEGIEAVLAAKFQVLLPHLDERQRRLAIGAEALSLGHGGIRIVAAAAGVREATVSRGAAELDSGQAPLGRVRHPGGGRKKAAELDSGLRPALLALVEPDERGDPMSPLRWTTKSTRKLAAELTRQGHRVSADTVAGLLREEGFSLQANAKTIEGAQHPDRDAQFHYLNEQARDHRDAGDPVISVDSKKKELIGDYRNAGHEWQPAGQPVRVKAHDFPGQAEKAIPYGIYDMTANTGWVSIGTVHDTAAFAVASIRRWWQAVGRHDYPGARRLLITADGGGSNGYRTRGWKTQLADLAAETGLEITVCHLPPGTSKWNKIEHRLFSHITMNWRGRPLTSHEVMLQTIAATTSRTGLTIQAELDSGEYPTGIRISDDEIAALPITRHRFHGDWNYTLHPQPVGTVTTGSTPDEAPADGPTHLTRHSLQDPLLTGMTRRQLSQLIAVLAPGMELQREQVLHTRRGHERLVAPGAGAKAKLTSADRVLATVLHLRKLAPMHLLGQLFNTTAMTISRAAKDVRPLLEDHGVRLAASTARFHTREDIARFLETDETKIKPAC
nr:MULTISPECIES: ISAzo13 family transposase [unclassified Streptomyces]